MVGLTSQIQKVGRRRSILAQEVIGSQAVACSIADDSDVPTFNVNVSQLVMAGNSLYKRHLGKVPIHHKLLLSIVRVNVNFDFGVIHH